MPTGCRSTSRRPCSGSPKADRFEQTVQEDEPFDRIRFEGGRVDPAEYLRLDFDLVDVNGTAAFYLVQQPIILLARDLPAAARAPARGVARPRARRLSRPARSDAAAEPRIAALSAAGNEGWSSISRQAAVGLHHTPR